MRSELSNRVRFYFFFSGVLTRQQNDPFCGICKAFANSVASIRESLDEFERMFGKEVEAMPGELSDLLSQARRVFAELKPPADAVGQKKAGNCSMPEGVCFVKVPKAVLEKIL